MKIKCSVVVFLLFVLPGYLLASSSSLFENVTLQKYDGWTYTGVSVRLAEDGNSVIVEREDGATLVISTDDVAVIVDDQGKEITTQVIPAIHSRYNEFEVETGLYSPSESGGGKMPQPPKLFNLMFSGGVGFGKPAGGYYEGIEDGWLYYGDVRIAISPLVYVKAAYRNEDMLGITTPVYNIDTGEFFGNAELKADARQYLVTFGILSRPHSKNNIRSYAEVGAGLVNHVASVTLGSWSEGVNEKLVVLAGEAGLMIPLSKKLGMDGGISVLTKLYGIGESQGGGIIFAAHLGVTMTFGGEN